MIFLIASAAFVGLVHSLAPGHWLPVVLMTKTRHWPTRTAVLGALAAAAGHVILSVTLGVIGISIGAHYFMQYEDKIERYSGIALAVFGLLFASYSFFRHSHCHGHTHHGPEIPERRGPFLFLFMLGFSPCVAALPVFVAASPLGSFRVALTMISFAVGVVTALVGATVLVSLGLMKLDHPILEHYGDVITGLGIALMGIILFFVPI